MIDTAPAPTAPASSVKSGDWVRIRGTVGKVIATHTNVAAGTKTFEFHANSPLGEVTLPLVASVELA